jgi:hypothetical protein
VTEIASRENAIAMTRDQNRLARDQKSLADHLKRLAIQTSEVKMAADVLERLKSQVISVRAGIARSASRTRRARLRSGAVEPVVILRILASFDDSLGISYGIGHSTASAEVDDARNPWRHSSSPPPSPCPAR